MFDAVLEHVNFTVTDPARTAAMLDDIFGWKIRWQGGAIYDGLSIHVGGDNSYVAIYAKGTPDKSRENSYATRGGLNHIGIVVDDLEAVEKRVKSAGFEPHSHGNYEPGRRFYFHDHDDIEFEVICYD